MAAPFDVVQGSAEFTGENTRLFPWQPQEEGCCHSGQAPGTPGAARGTPGSASQAGVPAFQEC